VFACLRLSSCPSILPTDRTTRDETVAGLCFSRSSFTIALNFGQVARNIVELPGWIGIEKFLPTDANRGEVFGGRVLNACAYIYAFDAREFAGRGLV
jgi:hypothetical protein